MAQSLTRGANKLNDYKQQQRALCSAAQFKENKMTKIRHHLLLTRATVKKSRKKSTKVQQIVALNRYLWGKK
jgi:hypothetical protein